LLLQKGNQRFNPSTVSMLLELESMFGRTRLWDNVMIGVTFWAYDEKSISDRERQGITEEDTLNDIIDHIMEVAHLDHPLEGIFLDSWATYYPNDEVQQSYFYKYAKQLWEKANSLPKFDFYTIEDILSQLDDCRAKNDCLNDVLANNITQIAAMVAANSAAIVVNSDQIGVNTKAVDHIGNDISTISTRVDTNEVTIEAVSSRVEELVMAPIGTVTAWLGGKTIPIPNGWQKCDGSPILDGPMNGTNTPNLNGEELFLRGGSVSNSWTVQPDQLNDHTHAVSDPGHTHHDGGHKHTDSGHRHTDNGHTHTDSGHSHEYLSTNWHINDEYDEDHYYRNPDDWHHKPQGHMYAYAGKANIQSSSADIQTGYSSIATGKASISRDKSYITVNGVSGGSNGDETRPKNMVVEWIIKIK